MHKLLILIIFLFSSHCFALTIEEYNVTRNKIQDKKDLIELKKSGKNYKIDIPEKPVPPETKDKALLQSRNKLIFLKEQTSIAQREYNNLIIQNKKKKILDIKANMQNYNITINELY